MLNILACQFSNFLIRLETTDWKEKYTHTHTHAHAQKKKKKLIGLKKMYAILLHKRVPKRFFYFHCETKKASQTIHIFTAWEVIHCL